MSKLSRFALGVLLVVSAMTIALVLGMFIGGHCCVSPDSGLAGGAIVFGYGVISAAVAGLAAILLAIKLPARTLKAVTLGCTLISAVLGGVLFKVFLNAQNESAAHLQQAYEHLLKFRVTLEPVGASANQQPFEQITFDWAKRSYSVKDKGRVCTFDLNGEQAAQMLSALRGVEGITYRDPSPCEGTAGPIQYKLDMLIIEGMPPNSEAKLEISSGCLQSYPTLIAPFDVANAVHSKNRQPGDC